MVSGEKLSAKVFTVASEVGSFIGAQRKMVQVLMWQLVERSGFSNSYLSQVERGLCKSFADALSQITKVLGVSAEIFIVPTGIFEPSATS